MEIAYQFRQNCYNTSEVIFDEPPPFAVKQALNKVGYRWDYKRNLFFGRADEETTRDAIWQGERHARFQKGRDSTLCWKCSRCTNGSCPWFADDAPVDGWKADKIPVNVRVHINDKMYFRAEDSYKVRQCPLYDQKRRRVAPNYDYAHHTARLARHVVMAALKDYDRIIHGRPAEWANEQELEDFFYSRWGGALMGCMDIDQWDLCEKLEKYKDKVQKGRRR